MAPGKTYLPYTAMAFSVLVALEAVTYILAALFLALDKAAWITGIVLGAAGGAVMV